VVAASYFIPLKSKELYCVSNNNRYSLLLGQSKNYEAAEGQALGINEGACTPSTAKATLYLL